MIEYVIRRAIIWAITIAVVAGVTSAVTNATRNAMSKSLENKLVELGIDKDNPDPELMKDLIEVDVVRRGTYIVSVSENVYGLFSTTYTAKNKNDAIQKLGSRAFGFANANKHILDKDVIEFYLRIWFETLGKNKLVSKRVAYSDKICQLDASLINLNYNLSVFDNYIQTAANKIQRLEYKKERKPNKAWKLDPKIEVENNYISEQISQKEKQSKEILSVIEEKEKLVELRDELKDKEENPKFVISKKSIGVKGMSITI